MLYDGCFLFELQAVILKTASVKRHVDAGVSAKGANHFALCVQVDCLIGYR